MEIKSISNRQAHDRTCRFRKINKKGIRVALEVTRCCNFKCPHCFVPKERDHPPLNQLIPVLRQLKDIDCQKVILTGGEPLLRNDLETIVECISNQDILVDLNSNFYLLNEKRLNSLRNAGLKEASASLYGNSAIHNKIAGANNAFEQIVNNIQLLVNHGLAVDIHAGIFIENIDQLDYIANLATNLKCDSLTFFSILSVPINTHNSESYHINRPDLLYKIRKTAEKYPIPINTIGLIEPDFNECSMCEAIVGINANLEIMPCLLAKKQNTHSLIGADLKKQFDQIKTEVKSGMWKINCV